MDPAKLFHPDGHPPRIPRSRRWIASLLVIAGFLLSVLAADRLLDATGAAPPFVEVISEKIDYLHDHGKEFDAFYLGTSTVYRCIEPAVVDSTLAAMGIPFRSLNLAAPGLSVNEGEAMLREVERLGSDRLRLVLVEPMFRPHELKNWATERAMAFHARDLTDLAVSHVMHTGATGWRARRDGLVEAQGHILSHLGRNANLGRFARWLLPDPRPWQHRGFLEPRFDRGGFRALEEEKGDLFDRRIRWYRSQFDRLERRMAEYTPRIWDGPRLSETHARYLREIVERIRAMGARPVFLVVPAFLRHAPLAAFLNSADELFPDVARLVYLPGEDAPPIYEMKYWYDSDHLTREGARILSARLGEDLAALLTSTTSTGTGGTAAAAPGPGTE